MMSDGRSELSAVTGAFGYTGQYIARGLLSTGQRVRTLTAHPERPNPFGKRVEVAPLNFDKPAELQASLEGVSVLYNTYWVRFDHGRVTFAGAVANTRKLIEAAKDAGVPRVVHISITNPSGDSSLPYFKGKAAVEDLIVHSGLSYAIIRPTVIFGLEDILINNIAWLLRRWPLFAIPGRGGYRLQPVFVEDVAELAVGAGHREENIFLDAVGPEAYTFNELIHLIAKSVGSRARIIHVSPRGVLLMTRLLGWTVRDVILTPDEIEGLTSTLLVSAGLPTCRTSFRSWLGLNASSVGRRYTSELARHFR
jgi:uncharacterized protein YbjT (DUF2867 family)